MSIIPTYDRYHCETVTNSDIGEGVKKEGVVIFKDSFIRTNDPWDLAFLLSGCRIDFSKIEANGSIRNSELHQTTIEGYGTVHLSEYSLIERSYLRPQTISMRSTKILPGARLYGRLDFSNATIKGFADIRNMSHYVTIGPIGSSSRYITLHREYWPEHNFWGHRLNVGCFSGTLLQFEERINDPKLGWPQEIESGSKKGRLIQLFSEMEYKSILPMLTDKAHRWQYDPVTEEDHMVWTEWIQQRGLEGVKIKADYIESPVDTDEVGWVYRNIGDVL